MSYSVLPPYILGAGPPGGPPAGGMDLALLDTVARRRGIDLAYAHARTFTDLIVHVVLGVSDVAVGQPSLVWLRYQGRSLLIIIKKKSTLRLQSTFDFPTNIGITRGEGGGGTPSVTTPVVVSDLGCSKVLI